MNSPEEWANELKEHLASAQLAANALLARGYDVDIKLEKLAPPGEREGYSIRFACTIIKKVYL